MLMGLRKSSETWLGRVVLGLVMAFISISFAIWSIGNIFHGFGHSVLASVGSTEVSVSSFRQAYQAQLQHLGAQTGQQITNEQAHAAGFDREVLAGLVADAALSERAKSLGLSLSNDQLRKAMTLDPNFRDQVGGFDSRRMTEWLQEQGLSQADLPKVYTRRQLDAALAGGLSPPRLLLETFNRYAGETRSVRYTTLPASAAGNIASPSDVALQKYFDERRTSYRAPEYRDILVLAVTPQTLATPADVSDADAQKLYDQIADGRFGRAERRTLQQLTFPTEAEAQAALAKIKAGKSFADIGNERHLAPGDLELGARSKAQVADEVAGVAFALSKDGVSEPIKTPFGYALVKVIDIVPGNLKPFADVAAEVKMQVALSRVKAGRIEDIHEKIENLRSSGKPLTEAAKTVGLTARAIPAIDAQGRDAKGAPVTGLVDGPTLLKAVFASDVGLDNETLQTNDRGYQWFEVRKISPAHDRGFAEVKPEVEKAWRSAEISKVLTKKVIDLYKKIDSGGSLEEAIPGAEVKTAEGLTRGGKTDLPAPLVAAVFATARGQSGSVAAVEDGRIIFKVTGVKLPPLDPASPQIQQLSGALADRLTGEVIRQYAVRLENEIGSKVDAQALRTAVVGGDPVGPIDMD